MSRGDNVTAAVTNATAAAADESDTIDETTRRERREIISRSLEKVIHQLNNAYCTSHGDRLKQLISKSISFPKNNNCNGSKGNNGKPHDAESRIALALYHQWKRDAVADRSVKERNIGEGKEKPNSDSATTVIDAATSNGDSTRSAKQSFAPSPVVTITSDLGLSRELASPRQLSELIGPLLEEEFRSKIGRAHV